MFLNIHLYDNLDPFLVFSYKSRADLTLMQHLIKMPGLMQITDDTSIWIAEK